MCLKLMRENKLSPASIFSATTTRKSARAPTRTRALSCRSRSGYTSKRKTTFSSNTPSKKPPSRSKCAYRTSNFVKGRKTRPSKRETRSSAGRTRIEKEIDNSAIRKESIASRESMAL